MQFAGGQDHALAQAAVAHHPKRSMVLATVGMASTAGVTLLAVEVWLDGATIARFHLAHALADGEDLDAEFVAGDARVAEEGHLAQVTAVVRAADADPMNAQERFTRSGRRRFGRVNQAEALRFFELDGLHSTGIGFSRCIRWFK